MSRKSERESQQRVIIDSLWTAKKEIDEATTIGVENWLYTNGNDQELKLRLSVIRDAVKNSNLGELDKKRIFEKIDTASSQNTILNKAIDLAKKNF